MTSRAAGGSGKKPQHNQVGGVETGAGHILQISFSLDDVMPDEIVQLIHGNTKRLGGFSF